MNEQEIQQQSLVTETANDRFKSSFSTWFWGSMITATVLHFVFFAFLDFGEPDDVSFSMEALPVTSYQRSLVRHDVMECNDYQ